MSEEYKNFNGYEEKAEEAEVVTAEVTDVPAAESKTKGLATGIIGIIMAVIAENIPSFYLKLKGVNASEYLAMLINNQTNALVDTIRKIYEATPLSIACVAAAFILSVLGIIFASKTMKKGRGFVKALGIIGLVLSIIALVSTVLLFGCGLILNLL